MEVDLIIKGKWTIPIIPRHQVLTNHAIVIKDKRIVKLCSIKDAEQQNKAKESITLPQHVLIPGLVNSHGHSPMVLLRGAADDVS